MTQDIVNRLQELAADLLYNPDCDDEGCGECAWYRAIHDAITEINQLRYDNENLLLGAEASDPRGWTHRLEHSTEILSNVHPQEMCDGEYCTVHNMSDHHMRAWPQHWRDDRKIMERICPHGVGHPDPDERDWIDTTHGCDGCCHAGDETTGGTE